MPLVDPPLLQSVTEVEVHPEEGDREEHDAELSHQLARECPDVPQKWELAEVSYSIDRASHSTSGSDLSHDLLTIPLIVFELLL